MYIAHVYNVMTLYGTGIDTTVVTVPQCHDIVAALYRLISYMYIVDLSQSLQCHGNVHVSFGYRKGFFKLCAMSWHCAYMAVMAAAGRAPASVS